MAIAVEAVPKVIHVAAVDYEHSSGVVTPLVVLDFDADPARLTSLLEGRGWSAHSLPLLAGLSTSAGPLVSLRSSEGASVVVEDSTGPLAEGDISPTPLWIERVRAHGHVGIIAGVHVTATPTWEADLARRAQTEGMVCAIATTTRYIP
jgi:hypothetical protein